MRSLLRAIPSVHRLARQAKRAGRLLTGRDAMYRDDIKPEKRLFGTVYGGWTIVPELLCEDSIVYSFGVGNDISFDLSLIREFGLTVHGFDPSPGAIQFIAGSSDIPSRYIFHPYGLEPQDGDLNFFRPAQGGMYSLLKGEMHTGDDRVQLSVKTLPTIISTLSTRYIDVLKMDIEGAEYPLIETLMANSGRIGQLLIEFHHRIGVAPLKETVDCVSRLRSAGYQLFHVSETSSEFSFLHQAVSDRATTLGT